MYRFSCGMTLLHDRYDRWVDGDSAVEESICESTQSKQVLLGSKWMTLSRADCRGMKICPISRDQRATPIWQDEDKIQTTLPTCMAENVQGFALEWVMWAGDGHLCGKVPEVGSVWWFPSITSTMS